jgi:hypothetical protein
MKVLVAPTNCMLFIKKRLAKMLNRVARWIKAIATNNAIKDDAPKNN